LGCFLHFRYKNCSWFVFFKIKKQGYDGGTVVLKLGSDRPVVSMDEKGKIVLAINNEVQQLTIKGGDSNEGEKVATTSKDLGTLELYPISITVR
jgi:coatomer subunit beta'